MANKYKEGQLLINIRSKAKTAKNKVVRVKRVIEHKVTPTHTLYGYDVEHADGTVELNIGASRYESFDEYRKRVNENLKLSNKVLTAQYQELKLIEKLERDGAKLFT